LDHRYALETQAAERYLLGELPAVDAEEFELHYFECAQCALAVESGEMFIAAARERFSTGEPAPALKSALKSAKPPARSFWIATAAFSRGPGFGLAAAAVLAVVALYQGIVTIPALSLPRPLPTFELIGVSRGKDPQVRVAAGTPFLALEADIPPEAHFRNYVCVISHEGREVLRVVNPAPEEGHPIAILVPASILRPGKQELRISGEGTDGQASDKISSYVFDFQNN